jgi:hypothetical protein
VLGECAGGRPGDRRFAWPGFLTSGGGATSETKLFGPPLDPALVREEWTHSSVPYSVWLRSKPSPEKRRLATTSALTGRPAVVRRARLAAEVVPGQDGPAGDVVEGPPVPRRRPFLPAAHRDERLRYPGSSLSCTSKSTFRSGTASST